MTIGNDQEPNKRGGQKDMPPSSENQGETNTLAFATLEVKW